MMPKTVLHHRRLPTDPFFYANVGIILVGLALMALAVTPWFPAP